MWSDASNCYIVIHFKKFNYPGDCSVFPLTYSVIINTHMHLCIHTSAEFSPQHELQGLFKIGQRKFVYTDHWIVFRS